jgi:hypothetical protein
MRSAIFYRLRKDMHFRIKIFLYFSFIFNIAYSIFLLIISQIYASKWFFATSIYHGLLSTARIFIFIQIDPKKDLRAKIITMRACGYFLLLINLVVSTMMFILLHGNSIVRHHEITVITLATYTFSSLSIAIISSIKHLKQNNHVYSCAKMISLTSASISLVTLTNTMLITFGENNLLLRRIILPLLCGVVSVFIVMSAILMIHKANLQLRILKNEKER